MQCVAAYMQQMYIYNSKTSIVSVVYVAVCCGVLQCVAVCCSRCMFTTARHLLYLLYMVYIPKVKWRGLTAFARRNKACIFVFLHFLLFCEAQQSVRFPQLNLGHLVLEFVTSPEYSETQITARDSHSNRLTSGDTEYNLSVY